jgi:ribosome biogenesis GTPase A
MQLLWIRYPEAIKERYGVEAPDEESAFPGYDLLMQAGKKRGFLMRGNEINTERMAKVLVDEYRSGKLGRFTLEMPEVEA